MFLLKRKPGITKEEFRACYEGGHVRIAKKYLGHVFADYRRNYIDGGFVKSPEDVDKIIPMESLEGEYDAVTQMVFADEAALGEFMRITSLPEVEALFQEDEQRFLDRPAMKVYTCRQTTMWGDDN